MEQTLVPPLQGAPPKAVGVSSISNFTERTDVGDGFPYDVE